MFSVPLLLNSPTYHSLQLTTQSVEIFCRTGKTMNEIAHVCSSNPVSALLHVPLMLQLYWDICSISRRLHVLPPLSLCICCSFCWHHSFTDPIVDHSIQVDRNMNWCEFFLDLCLRMELIILAICGPKAFSLFLSHNTLYTIPKLLALPLSTSPVL